MMRSRSRARSALGISLCFLTIGSGLATPLLERGDFVATATVESEHDPARCAPQHDHRVCTQVGANLALMAQTNHHLVAHTFLASPLPDGPREALAKPLLEGPPSRAPPLA